MTDSVYNAIIVKIAEFFPECSDIENISLDSLHIDSFKLIQIVLDLETTFGIEFEDSMLDITSIQSFGHLAHYVEKRILDGSSKE